jgi:heme-degrading monooxygenase HmoA
MYARVTELKVLSGKSDEFTKAVKSLLPELRRQAGFRALVVLRPPKEQAPEVRIVSLWDSHADLKGSEKSLFLYQALSRLVPLCEGFPPIREMEVVVSEFAAD